MENSTSNVFDTSGELIIDEEACASMTETPDTENNSLLMTSEDPFMAVAAKVADVPEFVETETLVDGQTAERPIMNDSSDNLDIDSSELADDAFNSLPSSPSLPDLPDLISSSSEFPEQSKYSDLVRKCLKPCWVKLEQLSAAEIDRYTSYIDVEYQRRVREARRSAKNKHKLIVEKFQEYKNYRQDFIHKKRPREWSFENEDFDSSYDEYKPPDSIMKGRKRKRKKLPYEEDIDWSPTLEREVDVNPWKPSSSRHKRYEKLRITTRRRRIESDPDSDSDFDYETYMYDYEEEEKPVHSESAEDTKAPRSDDIYDPTQSYETPPKKKSKLKTKKTEKPLNSPQNTMIDNDVLSRIMQEMADYNMKNRKGSKVVHSIFNGGSMKQSSSKATKNNPSKRKRIGIKVTNDILPPSVTTVQKLVYNMVDTVCTIENKRLKVEEKSKQKKCRWCGTLFNAESKTEILCVICKDTISADTLLGTKPKAKKKESPVEKVSKGGLKSKMMKTLSKNDQQWLMFSDKAIKSTVDKGYNHLKSFSPSREILNQDSVTKKTAKTKKGENKNQKNPEKSKGVSKPGTVSTAVAKVPIQPSKSNNIAMTNVDKGLFLMTFPDPDKELVETPKKAVVTPPTDTQANSAKTSTESSDKAAPSSDKFDKYALPTVPTVVVANYAASKTKEGDFILQSVYYQNEATQDANLNKLDIVPNNSKMPPNNSTIAPGKTSINNPLSMPTVNQLSMIRQTVPSNVYSNALINVSSNVNIRPPVSSTIPQHSSNLSNNLVIRNAVPNISKIGTNLPVTNANSNLSFSNTNFARSELARLINSGFQITPAPAGNTIAIRPVRVGLPVSVNNALYLPREPNISRLVSNHGLQITPAPTVNTSHSLANNISLTSNTAVNNGNAFPFNGQITPQLSLDSAQFLLDKSIVIQNINTPKVSLNSGGIPLNSENILLNASNVPLNNCNISLNAGNMPLNSDNISLNTDNISMNVGGTFNSENISMNNSKSNINDANQISTDNVAQSSLPFNANLADDTDMTNAPATPINENQLPEKFSSFKTSENDSNLEKEYREIEALSILSIMDLEKNPKAALLHRIDMNNKAVEELSKDKSKHNEYLVALNVKEIYKIAKKWLIRFGSFARLSEHFLKKEETVPLKTPMQIKKEHIEEEEEEMPACQFAENSSHSSHHPNLPDLSNAGQLSLNAFTINAIPNINHIANLETQVDSIADQLNSAGVDCTIPIPGITAMTSNNSLIQQNVPRNEMFQDSRETPSRGSGPRTPARPESAASHIEERVLTPAQIKRERMEAANSSPFSQCAFSGNNPAISQPSISAPDLQSMQPLNTLSQLLQSSVSQSYMPPAVGSPSLGFNSSVMPRPSTPNIPMMSNMSYTNPMLNQPPNVSLRTMPQNISGVQSANFMGSPRFVGPSVIVTNSSNYNNARVQNSSNYQNQVPPNRTVSFNSNQNLSKVFMDLNTPKVPPNYTQKPVPGSVNANIVSVRSGQQGQVYMQPQQQPLNQQLYNVQQVYLPNQSSLLQQSLNSQSRASPQTPNQYLVRQNPNAVSSTLSGGAVLLNSTTFSTSNMQQNNVYIQNTVNNFPQAQMGQALNAAAVQQASSPGSQLSSSGAFLMQNNKPQASVGENISDMICALCGKVATLRCKQCTKIAYCDPACAKTYWHSKHKHECKPLDGPGSHRRSSKSTFSIVGSPTTMSTVCQQPVVVERDKEDVVHPSPMLCFGGEM